MKRTALHSAIVAALAGSAAGPQLAWSQDSQLEEIIVTATFRETNVQDTPIAITAVTAEMLEARSQTNLAQITAQTPNVSLRPAGSAFGNALVAFIRGIGQTDFNPSVEPGVGIYVDDVYYSTITGNVLDLLDLERVEVLRGPQGTLAGRNAIGGAIKLFTRKPDGTDDATVSITKGEFNRTDLKGAAGITLVEDKLYARIAGIARTMDGYVDRLDFACAKNLPPPGQPGGLPRYIQTASDSNGCGIGTEGGQSYASGRVAFRWTPSDTFTVDFTGSIVNDDSESQPGVLIAAKDHSGSNFPWLSPNGPSFGPNPFVCVGVEPWPGGCAANNPQFVPGTQTSVPIYFDNNGNSLFDAGVDVPFDNRFATGGQYSNYSTYINDGKSFPSNLYQGGVPGQNIDIYKPYVIEPVNTLNSWDSTLNLNWEISDNVSLLWVMSHREYDNEFAEDTDGSPLAAQQLLQVLDHKQDTYELRANFTAGLLDLTVGAFYLNQDTAENARVDLPYVGFDFIHGPDLVPATSQAVFADGVLHLGDRVDLSLGVRHTEDEKSYQFRRRNPDLTPVQACTTFWFWEAGNPSNCGVNGLDLLKISYQSDNTDYRVALNFDLNDSSMIYGSVSTGYKAGGNNARPFFPSQLNAFDPETIDSLEVGFKSTFGGNVRFNAAIFANDYQDIQLPATVCLWAPVGQQSPCASQNNVGDADVKGAEAEVEWHLGDKLEIDASLSYLDFQYSRIDPGATNVTLSMVAPYTPESKASLGIQYDFSLSGGGTFTPRLDATYTDSVYASAVNAPTNLIDSYEVFNARATWRSASDQWEVALEATNLADKYYYVTLFDLWDNGAGYIHGQPSRPREYAMTVKRSF